MGVEGKFSYRFPVAFPLLRNDSATQISQSTCWRQHFGSGHVHKRHIIICIKGTNKYLLRVNSSLSVMLYYPSDLKSLIPTNAVNICAMNVQSLNVQMNVQLKYEKPPVHCSPYPPPHPSLRNNTKLRYCQVRHGSVLSLCVLLKLLRFPVGKNSLR